MINIHELKKSEQSALIEFAENNGRPLSEILEGVRRTKDGYVLVLALDCGSIKTLKGLEKLKKLESLFAPFNVGLRSLEFLPSHSLKWLNVSQCGIEGNLSALKNATKLQHLYVSGNWYLTSLEGIPLKNLKTFEAYDCGVKDFSLLKGARKLAEIIK